MTINKRDDYEKLAKLLYPSVEASGNVYYGQTKKLTTDEVFGKNKLNFDSHIETIKGNSYFIWKLGSLTDSIQIKPSLSLSTDNFPTVTDFFIINKDGTVNALDKDYASYEVVGNIFAKYELKVERSTSQEVIDSGVFNTYQLDPVCIFKGIYISKGINPINPSDKDILDRNFFVSSDLTTLYIQVGREALAPDMEVLKRTPLTISNHDNIPLLVKLTLSNADNVGNYYEYSLKENTWNSYIGIITLDKGDSVQLRRKSPKTSNDPELYIEANYSDDSTNGAVVFGNAYSVLDPVFKDISDLTPYGDDCLNSLLADSAGLVDSKHLILDAITLTSSCYSNLFSQCYSLKNSPTLPAKILTDSCYSEMFSNCSSLEEAPLINVDYVASDSLSSMFSNCLKLANVYLIAKEVEDSSGLSGTFSNCPFAFLFSNPDLDVSGTGLSNDHVNALRPFTIDQFDEPSKVITIKLNSLGVSNIYTVSRFSEEGLPEYTETWNTSESDEHSITITNLQRLTIELQDGTTLTQQDEDHYVHFEITGGGVTLSGNIHSLLTSNWDQGSSVFQPYCCFHMFNNNSNIHGAIPFLYGELHEHCFDSMFSGCTNIRSSHPLLSETAEYCYANMFSWCRSLENFVEIYTDRSESNCFTSMFTTCDSLEEVRIFSNEASLDSFTMFVSRSEGTNNPNPIKIYTPNLTLLPKDSSSPWRGIISGSLEYNVRSAEPSKNNKYDYLVTSGSDSSLNGRGLLSNDTKFNMIECNPFTDELLLDKYNKTNGSFNQEVWGYKQFNSPVCFKNGIYGECSCLITSSVDRSDLVSRTSLQSYDHSYSLTFEKSIAGESKAEITSDSIFLNGDVKTKQNMHVDGNISAESFSGVLPSVDDRNYIDINIGAITMLYLSPNNSQVSFGERNSVTSKYRDTPLTLESLSDNEITIKLQSPADYQYQISLNGSDFSQYYKQDIVLHKHDKVSFVCTQRPTNRSSVAGVYPQFQMSNGEVKVYGNINSMLSENFNTKIETSLEDGYNFAFLFQNCLSLVDASELSMLSNTSNLTEGRFYSMFSGCSNLKHAPELPDAPTLLSSRLPQNYYANLFADCISLTDPPLILPSQSLNEGSYRWMFYGCSSLKVSPVILSKSYKGDSCAFMFEKCTSLIVGPVIQLDEYTRSDSRYLCFSGILKDCSSLAYVEVHIKQIMQDYVDYFKDWLEGAGTSGSTHTVVSYDLDTELVTDTPFISIQFSSFNRLDYSFIDEKYNRSDSFDIAEIRPGQHIKQGYYISADGYTSSISSFSPKTTDGSKIRPFRIGEISISKLVGNSVTKGYGAFGYDYEFITLTSGSASEDSNFIPVLAMRIK